MITGSATSDLVVTLDGLCKLTVFDDQQIEDLVSFVGVSVNSTKKYNFTTSIETLIGVSDFCG